MKKNNENINDLTEMVFVLDKSGSMSGLEKDTVGGFNSMIKKQKGEEGRAYVSTVLFSNDSTVLHDRVKIEDVEPMTDRDYVPAGCTALLDAVGDAIHHIANIHKYARPEDVPGKTVFVITTDGMENASTRYSKEKIKSMIEKEQKKYGWEFIFLGANIDAVQAAGSIGISASRAANYKSDGCGTEVLFDTVTEVVSNVRQRMAIPKSWSSRVESDSRR
ncbi:MAG: VWA domain-containing protein [Ruminococcus sp.]|nr:VWA domain-containing protein [Ruminococcus sp.]